MTSRRDENGEPTDEDREDVAAKPADAAVRRALVEAHQDFLTFLRRRLGSLEEVEEVLQRFSLRALEHASELRDVHSVRGWLGRILATATVDHQRRAIRKRRREVAMEQTDLEDLAIEPDNEVDGAVCNCLHKLLPTLKPEYADVIWRADLLGEPRDRIAATLGVTLNNVTVRLHRGRQALKKRLEEMCLTCPVHGFLDSARCPFGCRPVKEILSDKVIEKLVDLRPGADYGPQDHRGGSDKHLIAILGAKGQLRTVEEIVPRSCTGFNEVQEISRRRMLLGLEIDFLRPSCVRILPPKLLARWIRGEYLDELVPHELVENLISFVEIQDIAPPIRLDQVFGTGNVARFLERVFETGENDEKLLCIDIHQLAEIGLIDRGHCTIISGVSFLAREVCRPTLSRAALPPLGPGRCR